LLFFFGIQAVELTQRNYPKRSPEGL